MATIDIATLAIELDTDARNTRKFLRAITPKDAQPGKGSRWAIEKRDIRSLRSKFTKFIAAQDAARLEKALNSEKGANAPQTAAEALDELGFEDPTDEQIEEMENLLDSDY